MYIYIHKIMPQVTLNPLWQKKERNERTLYCKTVNWGFGPRISYREQK